MVWPQCEMELCVGVMLKLKVEIVVMGVVVVLEEV